jgi:hypothetical protein
MFLFKRLQQQAPVRTNKYLVSVSEVTSKVFCYSDDSSKALLLLNICMSTYLPAVCR